MPPIYDRADKQLNNSIATYSKLTPDEKNPLILYTHDVSNLTALLLRRKNVKMCTLLR